MTQKIQNRNLRDALEALSPPPAPPTAEHPAKTLPSRTVSFDYLDNPLTVRISPALLEVNVPFRAGVQAWIQPLTLSSQLPDGHPYALSEEQAVGAMAKVYAMGVMCGSPWQGPTVPEQLEEWTPEEWERWLLEHPDEFETVRSLAPIAANFGLKQSGDIAEYLGGRV